MIRNETTFPADLILVASSREQGECFIATGSLDGEKNLKKRVQPKDLQEIYPNESFTEKDLFLTRGILECELPNKNLHSFNGQLIIKNKHYSLSEKQLLLKGANSGQADATAEFMFGVQEAYEIKKGKLGKLMRGATISGDAFEVLKSVDAVSSDFEWAIGTGHCGKGQPAKVDGGGPYVRCELTIGGR